MWLRARCDLTFDIVEATPFILMLRPRSGDNQWGSREEYQVEPQAPVFEFTDSYGNLCQRLVAPPRHFSVRTVADMRVADEVGRAHHELFGAAAPCGGGRRPCWTRPM